MFPFDIIDLVFKILSENRVEIEKYDVSWYFKKVLILIMGDGLGNSCKFVNSIIILCFILTRI